MHLYLYIANNNRDKTIIDKITTYKNVDERIQCYVDAKVFYLDDIVNLYYDDRQESTKNFKCDFYTINDGTVLNINKENYKLPNLIEAKYILTPVRSIFEIVKSAKEKGYPLFEENIREYLGKNGINGRMAKTLEDPKDRSNFFYYNNGITVICERIEKNQNYSTMFQKRFTVYNPQIVNGCQTVNTIKEVLSKYSEDEIDNEFGNTFVMVKLLVLDAENSEHSELYTNIVKYNNSQNAITQKAFDANRTLYFNLQKDFKTRGFLLAVKQSDAYKFKSEKFNDYRPLLEKYRQLFNLNFNKIEDIIIPLEK